jgi:hypothetical protein
MLQNGFQFQATTMEAMFRQNAVVAKAKSDMKIVRYFLAAGFLVPCLLYLGIVVGDVLIQGSWIWILLVPWPTFPLIMSAEGGGGTGGQAIAFLISAVSNVAIYGVVGVAFRFVYRRYPSRPS